MSLTLKGTKSALGPGLTASFSASSGAGSYVYSVVPGGAGGTINASSGLYTAPSTTNDNPALSSDIVRVTDAAAATAELSILVTDPLGLFCDVIQKEMNLSNGRVYLWDQKINQPKDSGLYIAVAVLNCKPFGNTNRSVSGGSAPEDGLFADQSVNMLATLQLSAISRGPEARTRKEEIILALESDYSRKQQEGNGFYIGKLPAGGQFVNLSSVDGAAIPYRFDIQINIQYFFKKRKAVDYFNDFAPVEITTES